MRDYRKLDVWQISRAFASHCYRVTSSFPENERFGLTSQIRRAAVSVPANIAEGVGRDSDGDFLRFLRIAHGSLNELETLFVIAADLEIIDDVSYAKCDEEARELGVKVRNLIVKIEADFGQRDSGQR